MIEDERVLAIDSRMLGSDLHPDSVDERTCALII